MMFNEMPVSDWIYGLSKLVIDQPKDSRNGRRAQLAILLNELEQAERFAEQDDWTQQEFKFN